MNRTEMIREIATKVGKTQKEVKEVVEAMQEVVFAEMAAEGEVKVMDGITLMGVHKDATTARNPQTGEAVEVQEKTVPKCKFGKPCKEAVNA